jgi:hypothetical protein
VLKRHNVQTGLSNLTTMQITGGLDENAVVALNTVDGRPMQNGMSVKTVGE